MEKNVTIMVYVGRLGRLYFTGITLSFWDNVKLIENIFFLREAMQAAVSRERTGMVQSIMMLSAAVEQVEELLDEPLGIFAYGQERRTLAPVRDCAVTRQDGIVTVLNFIAENWHSEICLYCYC